MLLCEMIFIYVVTFVSYVIYNKCVSFINGK